MTFRGELERRKRASMGQLLLRAARLFNERAIARVQRSHPRARIAHTLLYPHIDLEGTRLVELARRVGTSKQAVGQLVGELEGLGVVRREPDPDDARARLVRFTPRGRRALLHGLGVLRATEAELARRLGRARLRRLRADLAALADALERRPAARQR
jgi:DNA-binding MarR family transcriptional regulator